VSFQIAWRWIWPGSLQREMQVSSQPLCSRSPVPFQAGRRVQKRVVLRATAEKPSGGGGSSGGGSGSEAPSPGEPRCRQRWLGGAGAELWQHSPTV
jgi:hypothetical protein